MKKLISIDSDLLKCIIDAARPELLQIMNGVQPSPVFRSRLEFLKIPESEWPEFARRLAIECSDVSQGLTHGSIPKD